jgi:hypothetical protein
LALAGEETVYAADGGKIIKKVADANLISADFIPP